ncbi:hypothetical protein OXB_2863 [Bacillus sp. OxB-1]|uniref:hypothetical protein n=1 Tax=Bacillus sp. (strain OxB-1) TaxID=98228 RepID=UPI0005820DFE|nr:hypothetical protein [Bacillus sp. OxB-1]BAQ11334.1 hypothetical protein OXB_2863 [Bacillus sp. OxB-1]
MNSFYVYETQAELTADHYQQAEANGISRAAVRKRIKLGWPISKAIKEPILSQKEITERASAASPFRQTNGLHFAKEGKV